MGAEKFQPPMSLVAIAIRGTYFLEVRRPSDLRRLLISRKISLCRDRDEPRGVRHKPFSSTEKARWSGEALTEIAGPVPALRSGDLLGIFFLCLCPEVESENHS